MKVVFFILISFLIFSCRTTKSEAVLLKVKLVKRIITFDTLSYNSFKSKDTLIYKYSSKSEKIYHNVLIKKIKNKDSFFNFNGEICRLVGRYNLMIKNRKVIVFRYLYDKENSIDEEQEYYFTEKKGLLISNPLSSFIQYLYDSKNNIELHDSVVSLQQRLKKN